MASYVRQAAENGFKAIGFSDHAPVDCGYDPRHRMDVSEFSEYTEAINLLQQQNPSLQIRCGIEADIYEGFENSLLSLTHNQPVDYVIGTVHYIDGVFVFGDEASGFSKWEKRQLIRQYFKLIKAGIQSGLIDIVGHLDVIKWTLADMKPVIYENAVEILNLMSETHHILELNTSGLRKRPAEMYPDFTILQMAADLRIPVCLGSDAHRPEDVGADFPPAVEMLQTLGYHKQTVFRKDLLVYMVSESPSEV